MLSNIRLDRIPVELRSRDQWICWYWGERDGKKTKVPCTINGEPASSTDPSTWSSFEDIEKVVADPPYGTAGIGFVFSDDRSVTGLDLDHVLDNQGNLAKEYQWVVDESNTYIEVSPSEDGLHLFFLGGKPEGKTRCKRGQDNGCEVEMYDHGRFFTVTTNVYTDANGVVHDAICANPFVVERAYDRWLGIEDATRAGGSSREGCSTSAFSLSDQEVVDVMLGSSSEFKIRALMDGDTSAYGGDESSADLAFCNFLAFYCRKDADQMDRIFRGSGLMRPKWDEMRGSQTYGRITITRAISDTHDVYDPEYRRSNDSAPAPSGVFYESESVRRNDKDYSRLFARWLGGKVVFVPEEKSYRVWDGRHWVKDADSHRVNRLCKEFVDELVCYAQKCTGLTDDGRTDFVKFAVKYNKLSERKKLIEDVQCEITVLRNRFDANENLLNLRNCTLDLETFETRPHDDKDLITKIANVDYDPSATCEEWEKFLFEALLGDAETIAFLQVVMGLALTCDTSQECMFILLGKTRSGKSTTVETVMEMLNKEDDGYAKSCNPETFAAKRNDDSSRPSSDIARLNGCRFLVTSEPSKNMPFNVARLKQLTGRDTITARFLHENDISFKPTFTLVMAANNAPRVNDPTLFESDRVYVIPFDRHLEKDERDTGLKDRLTAPASLSGILNWCLEGLKVYRMIGLEPSAVVVSATKNYADDSDKIRLFINECLIPDADALMTGKMAYQVFSDWCRASGHYSEGKTQFFTELRKRGLLAERGTINGATYRNVVRGYRAEGCYIV